MTPLKGDATEEHRAQIPTTPEKLVHTPRAVDLPPSPPLSPLPTSSYSGASESSDTTRRYAELRAKYTKLKQSMRDMIAFQKQAEERDKRARATLEADVQRHQQEAEALRSVMMAKQGDAEKAQLVAEQVTRLEHTLETLQNALRHARERVESLEMENRSLERARNDDRIRSEEVMESLREQLRQASLRNYHAVSAILPSETIVISGTPSHLVTPSADGGDGDHNRLSSSSSPVLHIVRQCADLQRLLEEKEATWIAAASRAAGRLREVEGALAAADVKRKTWEADATRVRHALSHAEQAARAARADAIEAIAASRHAREDAHQSRAQTRDIESRLETILQREAATKEELERVLIRATWLEEQLQLREQPPPTDTTGNDPEDRGAVRRIHKTHLMGRQSPRDEEETGQASSAIWGKSHPDQKPDIVVEMLSSPASQERVAGRSRPVRALPESVTLLQRRIRQLEAEQESMMEAVVGAERIRMEQESTVLHLQDLQRKYREATRLLGLREEECEALVGDVGDLRGLVRTQAQKLADEYDSRHNTPVSTPTKSQGSKGRAS